MTDSAFNEKPGPGSLLKGLQRVSKLCSEWFERVAMVALVGIIISTLVDVIGAKLFGKPIPAGTEIVYFLQVVAIAGALAITKIDNKHIRLEFVDSLPGRLKGVVHFIAALLGLGLFVVLLVESFEYAQALRHAREVTSAARVALHPFVYWISLSCIPLCLVLLKEMVESFVEVVKR